MKNWKKIVLNGRQVLIGLLAFIVNLGGSPFPAHGAITTSDLTSGLTPLDMATSLLGGGITISNVVYTGDNRAAGTFGGGTTATVGFDSGVMLSSGRIADILGPNNSDNTTTSFGRPGDPHLQTLIPGFTTLDAATLEFDFVPSGDEVTFQYVFSSEEYNEFANTAFNDVFGFFINGVNYALLPDGVTTVSINNVNAVDNNTFYRNNDLNDVPASALIDIEADGLTVVLTLKAQVIPNAVNHIKLGIADAGDTILDSWVFIKGGSFKVPEDCANGIDDDLDGLTDNADPDCQVCGDNNLDPGETCDDGNLLNGDGCSASCQTEAPPDTVAPSCVLTAILPGPPTQIKVTTQDTGSGLASITPLISTNATVTFSLTPGTTDPVIVTGTKIDQSQKAQVMLEVKDVAGNTTTCDPVLTLLVRENGKPVTETLTDIPDIESQITIANGSPGIKNLLVTVNGVAFRVNELKDFEERSFDVSSAMHEGDNNTITLTAWGKPGSQATIIISE